jgi:hypothetical protein
MWEDRKSFAINISSVANQHMPTSTALIVRKVESLVLRHCSEMRQKCGYLYLATIFVLFILFILIAIIIPP